MNPDRLHVLLIGIDAYDGDGSLQGCVNDVDAVQGILLDRLGVPAPRITRLVSPRTGAVHDTRIEGRVPTLAAITAELARLAGAEVAPSDRVFIYYSGHGTQLVLEDAEGRRFPREAILPKDKRRGPKRLYLADWELNAAIARITERCLSATVVLDCCSSAGATRSPSFDTGNARFWPTEVQPAPRAAIEARTTRGVADGLLAQGGNCQVLAACQADEKAREADLDGRIMGHLSRSLCEQLLAADPGELTGLRWGQIWRQVEAAVLDRNPQQRPWLSAGLGRAVFGGDPDDQGDTGFAVKAHDGRYAVDAGTLAGVTPGARVAVYGAGPVRFPLLDSIEDRAARIGELRIESAGRAAATGGSLLPMTLPAAARGRLVAPGDDARIRVCLASGADDATAAELSRSPFVELTDHLRHADLELHLEPAGWILADDLYGPGTGRPRFPAVPPGRPGVLRSVVEHYYRYRAPLRLAHACHDLPRLLQLSVLRCDQPLTAEQAQTVALPEAAGTGAPRWAVSVGDQVCFAVHNHSGYGLYVTLLDAAASGRVAVLGSSQIPAGGRARFWQREVIGRPFAVSLPDGGPVGVDRIVAIGTTVAGLDLSHLRLDPGFAELIRPGRDVTGRRSADPPAAPPVERYTSATADLWTRNTTGAVS